MENLIFGLGVMVIGLLVVFLGLIILIVFIKVLSFITDRTTGEKKPEKAKPAAPVVPAPPVAAKYTAPFSWIDSTTAGLRKPLPIIAARPKPSRRGA